MDTCEECNKRCDELQPSQYDAMVNWCCVCRMEPQCDTCLQRSIEVFEAGGFEVMIIPEDNTLVDDLDDIPINDLLPDSPTDGRDIRDYH